MKSRALPVSPPLSRSACSNLVSINLNPAIARAFRGPPSGILPTARVIDHEQPRSVGLAPHHLSAPTRHRHRLAVGVSAADAPLCLCQRDIPVRALDSGHLDAELWFQRQETLHLVADRGMAGDHLSRFLHESGVW